MKQVWIRLSSINDVQRFVGALSSLPGDFELVSDQFILDARSLMGIFGFDLSKPLRLRIYQDCPETAASMKPYIVDTEEANHEQ